MFIAEWSPATLHVISGDLTRTRRSTKQCSFLLTFVADLDDMDCHVDS